MNPILYCTTTNNPQIGGLNMNINNMNSPNLNTNNNNSHLQQLQPPQNLNIQQQHQQHQQPQYNIQHQQQQIHQQQQYLQGQYQIHQVYQQPQIYHYQQQQQIYQQHPSPNIHSSPYLGAIHHQQQQMATNTSTPISNNNNNNRSEYSESTTSTSCIPPSVTSCMTPTMSSSQVVSPLIVGTPGSTKRKLEEDMEQFSLLKAQPLLVSSPLLTPVSQSPGLTSVQIAFQNASLSNPSTPLSMSPSLSPSVAPMSPSKKSKNSNRSKSKWADETGLGVGTTPNRWQKSGVGIVKGPWKEEEDAKLVELVNKNGPKEWSSIAAKIPGRIGKQCRERWFNHLSPDVRKTNWTPEEDTLIINLHNELGNKWTAISKQLDGRPANAIKNHWNSTLIKRTGGDIKNHAISNRDDDDDEDEDEDTNSPALSPISLCPVDKPSGIPSHIAHPLSNSSSVITHHNQSHHLHNSHQHLNISHSVDGTSNNNNNNNNNNYNIPPFVLSENLNGSIIQTTAAAITSSSSSIPTHQITGTVVAPQIIRQISTPSSSPQIGSTPTSNHNKKPLNDLNSNPQASIHQTHFQQQQQQLQQLQQQQQQELQQIKAFQDMHGPPYTQQDPSMVVSNSNYWDISATNSDHHLGIPSTQNPFTTDFHVFEHPEVNTDFLFFEPSADPQNHHHSSQTQQTQQHIKVEQQTQQTQQQQQQQNSQTNYDLNNLFNVEI